MTGSPRQPSAAGRKERPMKTFIKNRFEALSEWISANLGSPYAFMIASLTVIIWAVSGPFFQFSDTWQLIINTGTTICTFLMVFLLQNTGNRTIDEMQERLREMESLNRELLREIREQRAAEAPLRKVA
jgi:low affinity Fe/Cu permease